MRDTPGSDNPRLAPKDVDQARQDERVRDERRRAQLRQVAHERERQEYHHLQRDEVLDAEQLRAVRDREYERLQVLRDEDDVRGHEAQLRDHDRGEDREAHPPPVQRAADVAEAARDDELGLDQ